MATQLQQLASTAVRQSVNNGRLAPLQGFDTVVYIQDQQTGNLIPFGEFTGFQHTIRNATEPYLPLGNRTLSLLDGEIQIGWVAEQGKINLEATKHAIGFEFVGPILRFGRSPRFQIVIEYNAPELDESDGVPGYGQYDILGGMATTGTGGTGQVNASPNIRTTVGRYIFEACKIDAITSGAMAGRSVIADRIEGLAEGWRYEPLDQERALLPRVTLRRDVGARATDREINDYLDRVEDPAFNFGRPVPTWAVSDTN